MKISRRSVAGVLGVAALSATLAACGSSGHPGASTSSKTPALTKVSVGDFPTSALTLPFAVAEDQGFFRAAGLDVQPVMATSGPALVSELIGGTTQIAVEVPPNAFPAMQQGESLAVLPPYGRLDLALVTPTSSGVTDLHGLVGKRIGVTQVGAFTEKFAQYVLQTQGISPSSVTFVAVGTLPTQEAALSNHQIDATVLSSDAIAAATNHGIQLRTLASSLAGTAGSLGEIGLQSFWATTTSYRSSHPTVVKAFCTAISKAAAWLANDSNRHAGLPTIEKLLSVPAPVAGQVWDTVHTAWANQITQTRWSANVQLMLGSPTSLPYTQYVTGCS